MTARELISLLSQFPGDAQVCIDNDPCCWAHECYRSIDRLETTSIISATAKTKEVICIHGKND